MRIYLILSALICVNLVRYEAHVCQLVKFQPSKFAIQLEEDETAGTITRENQRKSKPHNLKSLYLFLLYR